MGEGDEVGGINAVEVGEMAGVVLVAQDVSRKVKTIMKVTKRRILSSDILPSFLDEKPAVFIIHFRLKKLPRREGSF